MSRIGKEPIAVPDGVKVSLDGGVFVAEVLSVIIQVVYFKRTGGKRIFLCAPVHHHFHLKGWSEPQVVVRIWLIGVAFAALSLITLKLR